jgi:hypothetical protein
VSIRSRYGWQSRCVGDHARRLFDQAMTVRGTANSRVPAEIFPYLTRVGLSCVVRGAVASPPPGPTSRDWGERLISRAAVAFGRHAAGLPPLPIDRYAD